MAESIETPKKRKRSKKKDRLEAAEIPGVPEVPEGPNEVPEQIPEVPSKPDEVPEKVPEVPEGPDVPEVPTLPDDAYGGSFSDRDPIEEATRLLEVAEIAHRLEWRWASFELYIVSPSIPTNNPPLILNPEHLEHGTGLEFVYPIHDYGFKMATSKGEDLLFAGMSMCKLYYTIEKMIFLLIERLKAGGVNPDTEVQVAFSGFMLAQRKAFESIINLSYNVVVTNFEPGDWGEKYLQIIKRLADKGYGYPPEAPRDMFRREAKPSGPRKSM